jgi:hypothetical protein
MGSLSSLMRRLLCCCQAGIVTLVAMVSPVRHFVRHVSTTKPSQGRDGLVVDTCLPKVRFRGSTVGQANAYFALSDFTRTPPPSPKLATLANNEYCAGKYYVILFFRGFELGSGFIPCTTCLLNVSSTTEPIQRRDGLVVDTCLA